MSHQAVRKIVQKMVLKTGIQIKQHRLGKDHLQRSMILFEESIKSEQTKQLYTTNLKRFMKFVNIESTEELATLSSSQIQQMLEDYLIQLKHTINPNSIPIRFTGVRHFCIMNKKNINWDIIRKLFPEKHKRTGHKPWTTIDIQNMLDYTKNIRTRSLIYFLAATGARIGVFDHELKFKYTKIMPDGCIAVKLYAGEIEEYWSFLTPQSVCALKNYCKYRMKRGESITKESSLFVSYDLKRQMTSNAVKNVIFNVIKNSGIKRNLEGNRYDIQMHHGFRKRFNTILKLNNSVNYNIAEKLMGHKNGLDGVYFVPTLEESFAEFKKTIPDLEI